MEQRAVIAVVLSVVFFIGWNYFVVKKRVKNVPELKSAEMAPESNIDAEALPPTAERIEKKIVQKELAFVKKNLHPSLQVVQDAGNEKDIRVQTNLTDIIFTNKGGLIKSLKLKKHLTENKEPLDIVMPNGFDQLPLYLEFEDPEISEFVNNIIFETSSDSVFITETNPEERLSFTYTDPHGLKILKTFTFHYDRYQIDIRTTIEGGELFGGSSSYRILWGPGINSGSSKKDKYSYNGATTFVDDEPVNDTPKKVTDQVTHGGNILWTALQNKFFAAVFVPKSQSSLIAVIKKGDEDKLSVGLQYSIDGSRIDDEIMLFAGPKEFDRIRSYNIKLDRLIDYGMVGNVFKFLVRPLFSALKLFYRFSHNYGISIIILTIAIKIVFLPLSQKSYKSMEAMKTLQPQIKIMQERYKNDKKKLNEEMMEFYKKNKVNPFGGCLPMLIQIPVFFALYNVLLHSVELRHAPFMFWIQDLSVKDPFYVTPILMGITMVIQQKMTPTTGDATQAKIMMFMPVIFTFMFLNFPVGLVIYWLVNNVATIWQQHLIARKSKA